MEVFVTLTTSLYDVE